MNQTTSIPLALFNGNDTAIGTTHQTCEFQLTKGSAHVLEMEDVLFHHNSAVMMPDNPKNSSGSAATNQQKKVSGVRTLALVFRQHQAYPEQKVLLAGHADRSGDPKINFEISGLRAQNVLFLLQGKRSEWADICIKKHKIEDYQQILVYFAKGMGWDCNPGEINNQWNKKTEQAIANFITLYNYNYAYKPADAILEDSLLDTVKGNGDKKWPKELWEAVFDLYEHDLVLATTGKHTPDEAFNKLRSSLDFVDPTKPFIACGESFPISQDTKQNYRSQQDRRVEILFFDKDEIPKLGCPARDSSVHIEDECPIYNKLFYNFDYITPESYFTALYHIKFVFYNKISKDFTPVPEGLKIKAWKEGSTELDTSAQYNSGSGIYELTVKGITNSPREPAIHFSFSHEGLWIYTKDTTTPAKLITKMSDVDPAKPKEPLTRETIDALPGVEQDCYYELPKKWDSRNWLCSLSGTTGDSADILLKATSASDAIIFNLDAIVLVDDKGTQGISDAEYNSALKRENKVDLSSESRIALLYLDQGDSNKLKIYNERADARHYSSIPFEKNFINDLPKAVSRIVYFNNAFYDITWKRTEPPDADIADTNKKYVCGARSAVMEDPDVHVKNAVCVNLSTGVPPNDYSQQWCGNYELHFLDACGVFENQQLAYLLIYWNCRVVPDATHPAGAGAITNWVQDGMVNSMEFSNRPYIIRKKDGSCNRLIRPFHYYEAKFNNRNGKHKCTVGITTDDVDWMLPETARFCDLSYTFRPAYYGADTVADIDGTMAKPLMSAHEMGHATGHFDDYLYNLEDGAYTYSGVPSYAQPYTAPGGPYNLDTAARMRFCRLPRMRDLWHFVNWLNDDSKAGKPLNKFLNGSSFKMAYTFTDPSTAADRTIEIDLADPKYRNTCAPSYKEESFAGFGNRNVSLFLYKFGGGETSETIVASHVLNGILPIAIKIAVKFVGYNVNANRKTWIENILLTPLNNLNRKFYLLCNTDNQFKKTLLGVTPYFSIYSGATAPAGTHYSIIVDNATPHDMVTSGTVVRVKRAVDGMKIVRYFFGLATNSVAALTKNDFAPVATWIGRMDVANGVFTVENF
jgi:outer membrane protein OmpA-like peptidoglycan-associated protein